MEKNPDILSSQMKNYQKFLKYEKNGPSSSPEFFNPILINDTEDNQLKEDDENKFDVNCDLINGMNNKLLVVDVP